MGEDKLGEALQAAAELAKVVPVYQDLAQPATRELGAALHTVARTVSIALTPLRAMVWGYDQIADFVSRRVSEKLKDVPPDRIVTPAANVAGPALEAMRFAGQQPDLREMYATLLATALDAKTATAAHPAFVEIIKQLTSDEARIVKRLADNQFRPVISVNVTIPGTPGEHELARNVSMLDVEANCATPALTPGYLDNLNRLGLTEIPEMLSLADPKAYEALQNHPDVTNFVAKCKATYRTEPRLAHHFLRLTDLGRQFVRACVLDKEPDATSQEPASGA